MRAIRLFGILVFSVFCFSNLAVAANLHSHTISNSVKSEAKKTTKADFWGYCRIRVINDSPNDLRVYGVFEDGLSMVPFWVYPYDAPHYIDLYFDWHCSDGMDLYIETIYGYPVYAGYTPVGSVVRIVPYLKAQPKAQLVK